jgi:hypothetical protein
VLYLSAYANLTSFIVQCKTLQRRKKWKGLGESHLLIDPRDKHNETVYLNDFHDVPSAKADASELRNLNNDDEWREKKVRTITLVVVVEMLIFNRSRISLLSIMFAFATKH